MDDSGGFTDGRQWRIGAYGGEAIELTEAAACAHYEAQN
jgi:hypothetical protein